MHQIFKEVNYVITDQLLQYVTACIATGPAEAHTIWSGERTHSYSMVLHL